MITVSWYPGALKGATVQQTQQAIIRGLQLWMGRCAVRFGTLPAGQRTQITIYPYAGAMPGIMAAYQQTGQILYSTSVKIPLQRCPMFFAHEVGHCFGWGHSDPNRTEAMMHWRGSEVDYMEPAEGRRAIAQFGRTAHPVHPWSLKLIGDEIRKHEPAYNDAVTRYQQTNANWKVRNSEWIRAKKLRDAETDPDKRAKYQKEVEYWLKQRDASGKSRQYWHGQMIAKRNQLMPLWQKWARINRGWSQVSAANITESMMGDQPCSCFEQYNDGPHPMVTKPLKEVFKDVARLRTQPIGVN